MRWLEVDAGVRYWEDGEINGEKDVDVDKWESDSDASPKMPFAEKNEDGEWRWRIKIDIDNGRIEGWPAGNTASIHYKVCDDGCYKLTDSDGNIVMQGEDVYVPDCIGEYGDYIVMEIDGNGYIDGFDFTQDYFNELAEEWNYLEDDD